VRVGLWIFIAETETETETESLSSVCKQVVESIW